MSMTFNVYVGPYLTIPGSSKFDLNTWDAIVRDGRDIGIKAIRLVFTKEWILIPGCRLEGIRRQMQFDQHLDFKVASINPATIVQEMAAFSRMTSELVHWCDDNGIEVHEAWGVVPWWS